MKKRLFTALLLVMVIMMMVCVFAACSDDKQLTVVLMNGDEIFKTLKYDANEKISLVDEIPTPDDGKRFVGWYTDKECTHPFVEDTEAVEHLVLFAKFDQANYYITVNSKGGSEVPRVSVDANGTYTLTAPTKEGYTFKGYIYDNGTEEVNFPLTGTFTLNKSIRLIAEWEINTYKVTIHGVTESDKGVEYNKTIDLGTAVKVGYTFVGWYLDETFETAFENGVTKITKDTDVFAKFTANSYQIKFVENGNITAVKDVTFDADYTLTAPTKVGYDFAGYTNNGISFPLTGKYNVAGDLNLVANWSIKKFQVEYKLVNDTEIKSEEVDFNKTANGVTLANCNIVEGENEIEGYYSNKECSVEVDLLTPITANTTIYVKIVPCKYSITVINYSSANQVVAYGAQYTLPDSPEKDGKIFDNYTLNDVEFTTLAGTYNWKENIVIVANFHDDPMFNKIYVNYYDGDAEMKEEIIDKNSTANVTTVNTDKTGYTFIGWFTDKSFENGFVSSTVLTEDTDLYAKYTLDTYTISYVLNDGENNIANPTSYNVNSETITLANPTKQGYTFNGWDNGGKVTKGSTGNKTFTASWTRNVCTVTFSVNSVTYDTKTPWQYEKVTAPSAPAKTGYTFVEWRLVDTSVAFDFANTAIENDITLEAYFTANSYKIYIQGKATYTTDRGIDVVYGETYSLVDPSAEIPGYYFNGYVLTSDGTTVYSKSGTFENAGDLYIKELWVKAASIDDEGDNLFVQKEGGYFKERETTNDEFTYVFLTGGNYNLGNPLTLDTAGESLVTLNEEGTGFTVGNNEGTFTLIIRKTTDNVTVAYEKNIKIVKNVSSFTFGSSFISYNNASNDTFKFGDDKNNIQAGCDNFIPDVAAKTQVGSSANVNMSLAQANLDIIVEDNDVATSDFTFDAGTGAIDFGTSLIGKTVEVTMKPKYSLTDKSLTYTLDLNNGVNVYTNDELYNEYGNLENHEVNILRNITAAFNANELDANGVPKNWNNIGNTKRYSHGLYTRVLSNQADNITVNGNYFRIEAENVPLCYEVWNSLSVNYQVANIQIGIFVYYNEGDTENSYNRNGIFNINNIDLHGNLIWEQRNKLETAIGSSDKQMLSMSAAISGLRLHGGTLNANHVNISDCCIGIHADGGIDGSRDLDDNFGIELNVSNSSVLRSWADAIYMYKLAKLNLVNTDVKYACGALITTEDPGYTALQTSCIATNINVDSYTASHWENLVSGEEAWFNAYGFSTQIGAIKTEINGSLSSRGLTVAVKVAEVETVNFILLVKECGSRSAASWKNEIPTQHPTFVINGTTMTNDGIAAAGGYVNVLFGKNVGMYVGGMIPTYLTKTPNGAEVVPTSENYQQLLVPASLLG